jgi:iron complex outermembrane receptor protein
MRKTLFVLLLFLPKTASSAPEKLAPVEVVEAREQPEREGELAATEPGVVEVIHVEDEGGGRTVADVLADTVGVQVQKMGGLGQFAQVSIRGSAADQVAIFLDGVPLARAAGGAVNLADLPLGQIERIEIYRGPMPSDLPGLPAGGAINLITRAPKERLVVASAISAGSFLTRGARGLVSLGGKRSMVALSMEYKGSRGDYAFLDDNGTPHNETDDQEAERRNNAFDQGALHLRAELSTADASTLRADLDAFLAQRGISGISSTQSQYAKLTTQRWLGLVSARAPTLFGWARLGGTLGADLTWTRERFDDRQAEVGLGRRDLEGRTLSAGLRATLGWQPLDRALFTLIAAPRHERYVQVDHYPEEHPHEPSARHSLDLALAADVDLYQERLWLTPQLRALVTRDRFAGPVGFGGRDEITERDEVHFAPSLGVRAQPKRGTWLRASIYSGVRVPSFYELFGDRGLITGNPALEPESVWGAEASASLSAARLYLEASAFYKRARQLIQFVQNSQFTSRPINLSQADLAGAEARASYEWAKRAGLGANYTCLYAVDRSDIPFYADRRLPRRPEHEVMAEPYVRLLASRALRLSTRLTHVSSTYLDRANLKAVPGRTLLALEAAVDLPGGLRVELVGENLLGVRAQDFEGFPLPGRSVFLTVSHRLARSRTARP